MSRTFNTPHRESWNVPIHYIIKAIDNHTQEYLREGDVWHLHKSNILKQYIKELKDFIQKKEGGDK